MNNLSLFVRGINSVGSQGCRKVKIEPSSLYHNHNESSRKYSSHTATKPEQFRLNKCLLVSKMTKYEYERHRHKGRTEEQLQKLIVERGTDYPSMMSLHSKQKAFEMEVAQQLRDMGIEVQVVNRLTYTPSLIEWCDAVVPCGGDGTFLLAASKVTDSSKPVIGFNSDPQRSVGRLCLPKWCSDDIRGAISCLKEGRFRWLHRTRIRTEVSCDNCINGAIAPLDLHTPQLSRYAGNNWYAVSDHNPEMQALQTNPSSEYASSTGERYTKVLPYLALNEVFIGENISARVSHFRVTVDGGLKAPPTDTKSSGLCITTGTGSTSWHLSINCLRTQSVQELLRLVSETGANIDASPAAARAITEKYNQNLIFSPEERRLSYSVRELITSEEWPVPRGLRPRDLATSLHVKSRCIDAGLVIDGGVSFPFNDGTEALLLTRPEDALKCVTMEEM